MGEKNLKQNVLMQNKETFFKCKELVGNNVFGGHIMKKRNHKRFPLQKGRVLHFLKCPISFLHCFHDTHQISCDFLFKFLLPTALEWVIPEISALGLFQEHLAPGVGATLLKMFIYFVEEQLHLPNKYPTQNVHPFCGRTIKTYYQAKRKRLRFSVDVGIGIRC